MTEKFGFEYKAEQNKEVVPREDPISVIELTRALNFEPIELRLNTRRDCAIAVYHMWRFAIRDLDVSQVFQMLNMWAQKQPEREEVMREIITTIAKKYCPHYTITVVEHDPKYQALLKEHRELAGMASVVRDAVAGNEMYDNTWGTGEQE